MRKILIALFLHILCFPILFAQDIEEASQVVLPIEIYVGDQAEIRYTFRSAVDFFPGEQKVEHKDLENPFVGLEDDFSVVKSELYCNDMEYTVRFVIVPWKVGTITFPTFDLNTALGIKSQESSLDLENPEELEFLIALYPVQIKSIVEKTGNSQMMPPAPPFIVPGTTYIIFLIILLFIILLIAFFSIILRFNTIKRKWEMFLLRRAYKRNANEAIKKIKRLIKNSKCTDIEFCSELQSITRQYLDFRFSFNFSAISSSFIPKEFEKICAGQLPLEISSAVDDLTAMFVRTDYIRYAHDSIDSQLYPPQEHQAALIKNERANLTTLVIGAIEKFESEENSINMEEKHDN